MEFYLSGTDPLAQIRAVYLYARPAICIEISWICVRCEMADKIRFFQRFFRHSHFNDSEINSFTPVDQNESYCTAMMRKQAKRAWLEFKRGCNVFCVDTINENIYKQRRNMCKKHSQIYLNWQVYDVASFPPR